MAARVGSEPLDLSVPAHPVVEAQALAVVLPLDLPELADLVQEGLPRALAHLVVEAAQLLQLLRSPSFSAAMARRSLPPVQPTYARAPNTR